MEDIMTLNIPVLALRGLTVFPHMSLTFDVERRISIAALERAMEGDQDIFLVTQREIGVSAPTEKDLYAVGTVSHITQILSLIHIYRGAGIHVFDPPHRGGWTLHGPNAAGRGPAAGAQFHVRS